MICLSSAVSSVPNPTLVDAGEPWCAGLPHVGNRALTEIERSWTLRRVASARRRLAAALAVALLTALGTAAVIVPGTPPLPAMAALGATWLVEAGLVGLLFALVAGPRSRRVLAALGSAYLLAAAVADAVASETLGRSLGRDVAELTTAVASAMLLLGLVEFGVRVRRAWGLPQCMRLVVEDLGRNEPVLLFEGPAAAPPPLVRGRLGRNHPTYRLEVLPHSRLVLRTDGHPVRTWATASIIRLAPARLHALRVELPQGVAHDSRHRLLRRGISPAERKEMMRQSRRLIHGVGGAALIGIGGTLYVVGRLHLDPRFHLLGPGPWVWYLLMLAGILLYLGRLRAGLRLREDARVRWLVTVHDEDQPADAAPRMEVLPVSRLVWTENSQPALWRAR